MKMMWGEIPTMWKLRRDGRRNDDACPLCGETDDNWHFSQCMRLHQSENAKKIMGNLGSRLRKRKTSPVLAMWIMETVKGRQPPLEEMGTLRLNMLVRGQYQRQAGIGWRNFADGRAAQGVVRLQEWWQREVGEASGEKCGDARETVA